MKTPIKKFPYAIFKLASLILVILALMLAAGPLTGSVGELTGDTHGQALQSCPAAGEEVVDLEILALENTGCGEVVRYTQDGRLNYRIECESGDSYRIHVSAEGHVKLNIHEN